MEGKKEVRREREIRIDRDGLEGKSVISNRMGIAISVEYE
jgi:hypothetical protein